MKGEQEEFEAYVPDRLIAPQGWRPSRTLRVPKAIWDETWRLLRPYGRQGVECPALWHGVEDDAGRVDTVRRVTLPRAKRDAGFYHIDEEETARIGRMAREAGLVALAQIHTHPVGYGVIHSLYDDRNAISLGEGFVSLVFPDYALHQHQLEEVGVHERIPDQWVLLDEKTSRTRIEITDESP